jgi:RimJ/RimL family protein N-acetyltransferase
MYRKTGYEEKCLIEVIKFAFNVMDVEKLVAFVFEANQYFYKLLIYIGFKLNKIKPK